MSKAHDDFSVAFGRFLDEVGIAEAMSVATGMFVSLAVGYIKHNGADANKTITIDGGNLRDVTIHPPKTAQRAAKAAKENK
jgi:hypothetical protein